MDTHGGERAWRATGWLRRVWHLLLAPGESQAINISQEEDKSRERKKSYTLRTLPLALLVLLLGKPIGPRGKNQAGIRTGGVQPAWLV